MVLQSPTKPIQRISRPSYFTSTLLLFLSIIHFYKQIAFLEFHQNNNSPYEVWLSRQHFLEQVTKRILQKKNILLNEANGDDIKILI